jgi:hypothetical protein
MARQMMLNESSANSRIGNSWAGRAFHQLFVRYWAVVPG